MKPTLSDMTVLEVAERFKAMALEQDDALLDSLYSKYNRLYDQMETLVAELKRRHGDQRQALLPLLQHPNAQVRLKAAIATLTVAPDEARKTLESISDRNEYPQAADARGIMEGLDDGSYSPT